MRHPSWPTDPRHIQPHSPWFAGWHGGHWPHNRAVRKLRLWGIACLRTMLDQLKPHLLQMVERMLRQASLLEISDFEAHQDGPPAVILESSEWRETAIVGAAHVCRTGYCDVDDLCENVGIASSGSELLREHHQELCQEIFGPPIEDDPVGRFQITRGVTLVPDALLAWQNGTVLQLAKTIDAEQRFDELPVLADALEEADSDERSSFKLKRKAKRVYAQLLAHLRQPDPHVKGCWALDGVLGDHIPYYRVGDDDEGD